MFSDRDRAQITRIEAKADMALSRISVIEGKQATHEAICDQREKSFDEYKIMKNRENERSAAEWDDFRKESSSDRARIRTELWDSNSALLWKIVLAMGTLLAMATGAMWELLQRAGHT